MSEYGDPVQERRAELAAYMHEQRQPTRAEIAMHVMAGFAMHRGAITFIGCAPVEHPAQKAATEAVLWADELLKALEKKP